jgi:hypothetical protein
MTIVSAETKTYRQTRYSSAGRDVYSQFGEDGIIEGILKDMPQNKWCVEFGAWDGIYLSNTCNLIRNRQYRAVLIEADPKRFSELNENIDSSKNILINKFIRFEGHDTLDNTLLQTGILADFDFLSIDIDGNDYYIFESLSVFRPKVICIEFNPTIPNEVIFVQKRDFRVKHGASAGAIMQLATRKGYALVAATYCNLFFVDQSMLHYLGLEAGYPLDVCRDDEACRCFLFTGYDGTVFSSRPFHLGWHPLTVTPKGLQVLPALLRAFSGDYTSIQKRMFRVWRSLGKRSGRFQ